MQLDAYIIFATTSTTHIGR